MVAPRGLIGARITAVAVVLGLVWVTSCARSPVVRAPAPVTISEGDDLAVVVRRARELASELGRERVLLAFDIDNTLLAMETALGSDAWYDWQKELAQADPCDVRLVPDRLAAQGALYHAGAMRPTQGDLPELIERARESGHPIMIITARGSGFRLSTFRELRRNGLSVRDTGPGPRGGFAEDLSLPGAVRPVRYEDGVLMLAGQDKGRMLLALYRHLDLEPPAAVVFADDKTDNIDAMAAALQAAGIRGELLRYSREDARRDAFPANEAALQWARLEPALRVVESIMGSANFDLPVAALNPVCLEP